jgi:hypothetical protein
VGQAPDDAGSDPVGQVAVVDHNAAPALEVDDHGRVAQLLAQADLDDLAPLAGPHVVPRRWDR